MLKKKDFIRKVIRDLPEYLPEDLRGSVEITETSTTKTNDQKCTGIMIRREGEAAVPTIYLDDAYEQFTRGEPYEAILHNILSVYLRSERGSKSHLMMPPTDPDGCVTLLALRLLSADRNREFLKEVPYRDVGNGLVLTCDIRAWDERTGEWRMRITHEVAEMSGMDEKQLFDDALYTCSIGNPAVLTDLDRRCAGKDPVNLLDHPERKRRGDRRATYVLTTKNYRFGATGLFYTGIMERIADWLDDDYYVIPTSVHEVLIIPDRTGLSPERMLELLEYSNRCMVEPQDILSDTLYHYDRDGGGLRVHSAVRAAV